MLVCTVSLHRNLSLWRVIPNASRISKADSMNKEKNIKVIKFITFYKFLITVEFLNKELLNICYKKHNKEMDLTWEQVAQQYRFSLLKCVSSGFKRIRRENGEIVYKDKTKIIHISDDHYLFILPKDVFKDYVGKVD